MIDVATPACWSCVTVDTCHRLCAGCTDSGLAATEWACRNCVHLYGRRPAAKMQRKTGPHSTVARSMSPRWRLSVSCQFIWLVLLMSMASRSSLNTWQTGNSRERQHVSQMATLNKGVTEPCHYPL